MNNIKKPQPYEKLRISLAELISNSPPGERLPTEPVLAKHLGVSRATLREAMRSFESQGLIRRRQGIGTFVVGPTQVLVSGLEVLESIETLADRIGLDVSMDDLNVKFLHATRDQAAIFDIPEGDQLVQVSRVMRTDNRPVAYLIDTLGQNIISADELVSQFSGSVLDLFIKRGYPALSYSDTEIRVVDASSEIARELEIQRGDGLLLFVARLFDAEAKVVDHSYSYFLPGYFKFNVVRSIGNNQTVVLSSPDADRRYTRDSDE
jgi:GntR family transcriptional regulator